MAINYLDVIGEYYADSEVYTKGDPEVYDELIWETTPITQAELDAVYLVDYKTQKIIYFSELATEDVVSGFESLALGYPHWYDSSPEDQLNLVGSVAAGDDMYYACKPASQAYQTVTFISGTSGTTATGLANSATTYNAEVIADGASSYISVKGEDAQTYEQLVTAINSDVDFSNIAEVEMVNNVMTFKTKTYGASGSLSVLDANLFNQLAAHESTESANAGVNAADAIKDYKLHSNAQLIIVTQSGRDVKLSVLQKFNVKKQQILNATSIETVDLITW